MSVIPNLGDRGKKRPGVQGHSQLHGKIRGQPRLHKTLSHKQQKKWPQVFGGQGQTITKYLPQAHVLDAGWLAGGTVLGGYRMLDES